MATRSAPPLADLPLHGGDFPHDGAAQRQWRKRRRLSSVAADLVGSADAFLGRAGFDRGPWLAVGFASGIGAWFLLDTVWEWAAFLVLCGLAALFALAGWRGREDRSHVLIAVVAMACVLALGMTAIWARSATVGAEPIAYPRVLALDGRILAREDQPAEARKRFVLRDRKARFGKALRQIEEIGNAERRMRFASRTKVNFHTKVHLDRPVLEPAPASFGEMGWFRHLRDTQKPRVKIACLILASKWHGKLNVVEPHDHRAEAAFLIANASLIPISDSAAKAPPAYPAPAPAPGCRSALHRTHSPDRAGRDRFRGAGI